MLRVKIAAGVLKPDQLRVLLGLRKITRRGAATLHARKRQFTLCS